MQKKFRDIFSFTLELTKRFSSQHYQLGWALVGLTTNPVKQRKKGTR